MWFRKIVRRPSRYSGITWLSLYSVTKIRQMSTDYLCCQGLEDQASGNYSIRTYVLYEEINFPVKSFLPDSEKQITWNFAESSNRLWKKRSCVQNSCWTTHTSFYYYSNWNQLFKKLCCIEHFLCWSCITCTTEIWNTDMQIQCL